MKITFYSLVLVMILVSPLAALTPGTDILVPAAARAGSWVTDLYVMNPGETTVTTSISWLLRGRANTNPTTISISLQPGETRVMNDVLLEEFGIESGGGAFRVEADGEVIVNSRIFSREGEETFGQGFEGVPVEAATTAGNSSEIVGLSQESGKFRTNFYCLAGENGAVLDVSLVASDGSELAAGNLTLGSYEPYLKRIDMFLPCGDFSEGTLRVGVREGMAVVGASKVDELSTDPTTLEGSTGPVPRAATIDGEWNFTLTDNEGFKSGGVLVIENGIITQIDGTYINWDKDENTDGMADCPLMFRWGAGFPETPVEDMVEGRSFSDTYVPGGSGEMNWTLSLEVDGTLNGVLSAVGQNFPEQGNEGDESGCNGSFPELVLSGAKAE